MLDTWLVLNGHKGVNQQGNKSLLSYRTGYGVPVRVLCWFVGEGGRSSGALTIRVRV